MYRKLRNQLLVCWDLQSKLLNNATEDTILDLLKQPIKANAREMLDQLDLLKNAIKAVEFTLDEMAGIPTDDSLNS